MEERKIKRRTCKTERKNKHVDRRRKERGRAGWKKDGRMKEIKRRKQELQKGK